MELQVDVQGCDTMYIIEVPVDATVGALETIISKTCSILPGTFHALYDGKVLDDGDVEVHTLGVQQGDVLSVSLVKAEARVIQRRERLMYTVRHEVRQKLKWFDKIRDDSITAKWTDEVMAATPDQDLGDSMVPAVTFDRRVACARALSVLLHEADLIAAQQPKLTPQPWYMRHRDGFIPSELGVRLNKVMQPFRAAQDWHPGSNEQVLDLIHPSLFCLVKDSGGSSGKHAQKRRKVATGSLGDRPKSDYAWIPTDFRIEEAAPGEVRVVPEGYINNLPEDAQDAQRAICDVLGRFVPLLRTVRDIEASGGDGSGDGDGGDGSGEDEANGSDAGDADADLTKEDKQQIAEEKARILEAYGGNKDKSWVVIFKKDNGPSEYFSHAHDKTEGMSVDDPEFIALIEASVSDFLDLDSIREVVEDEDEKFEAPPGMDQSDGEGADGDGDGDGGAESDDDSDGKDSDTAPGPPVLTCPFTLAFGGDLASLKRSLFINKLTVNYLHKERDTSLLYTAARFGHLDMVKWLVRKHDAYVNQKNGKKGGGSTPLHGAAYGGHAAVAEFLIKNGADKTAENAHGDTPARDAAGPDAQVKKAAKAKTIKAIENTNNKSGVQRAPSVDPALREPKDGSDDAPEEEPEKPDLDAKGKRAVSLFFEVAKLTAKKGGSKGLKAREREAALRLYCKLADDSGSLDNTARVADLAATLRARKKEESQKQRRELQTLALPAGSKLQVIVKAADILLTPEKPVYPGGTWHLEGTKEENIVATGIYYYDTENVTASHLAFRGKVDYEELGYEQCEHDHIFFQYGVEPFDECNVLLGEVSTPEGRCIAFPNDLQHRASPFQLVDHSKPGHRKMLVFFVVDPRTPVTSTSEVPRQQEFLSLEQAQTNRLALMEARKGYRDSSNEEWVEEISLCEH